jgi:hypothetical protein
MIPQPFNFQKKRTVVVWAHSGGLSGEETFPCWLSKKSGPGTVQSDLGYDLNGAMSSHRRSMADSAFHDVLLKRMPMTPSTSPRCVSVPSGALLSGGANSATAALEFSPMPTGNASNARLQHPTRSSRVNDAAFSSVTFPFRRNHEDFAIRFEAHFIGPPCAWPRPIRL